MILITGAAGFIASYLVGSLNALGYHDLILVDDFKRSAKQHNLYGKQFETQVPRDKLWAWLAMHRPQLDFVLHIGARTDTSEQDESIFDRLNLDYSQKIWRYCTEHHIPLIYASSAATYGDGQLGFADDHTVVAQLRPLNPYGWSKQNFDLWVLNQQDAPPFWAGLKFFNVYGPNEYHKGRMASVIFHTFNQIKETGKMRLFRSHRDDYAHGEQKRDFVYVQDLWRVIRFMMEAQPVSGLFNLGSGRARSFNDLVRNVFLSLNLEPQIQYIDTPQDIRAAYQYFTEAEMTKLRRAGFATDFTALEDGIREYVQQFLSLRKYF